MEFLTRAHLSSEITELEMRNQRIAYEAACEGIVLLKNDGALPLQTMKVAIYGPGAKRTIKGGTGSGEVNERHSVSILEGMEDRGFEILSKQWIEDYELFYENVHAAYQIEKKKRINLLHIRTINDMLWDNFRIPAGPEIRGVMDTDSCVYVLSRQAGEGGDRKLDAGDFLLTPEEKTAISYCAAHYEKFVLVINCGSSLDMGFLEEIEGINAVLYICQSGTQGGNAVADVLSGDDQKDRADGEDSLKIKLGQMELGQGKESGFLQRGEIHNTNQAGGHIAADHGDQQGDHREEPTEQNTAKDGHTQGDCKDQHISHLHGRADHQAAGGVHRHQVRTDGAAFDGVGGQFQTDKGHHRTHGRRGQDDVDPVGAELPDNEGHYTAQQAHHNESALGVLKAHFGNDDARRSQESEAGAQISRSFTLGDQDEEQRTHAIHQQNNAGVDAKEDGDQHRCAKHGEDMLDAQGDQLPQGQTVFHLNDSSFTHDVRSPIKKFSRQYTTFSDGLQLFALC